MTVPRAPEIKSLEDSANEFYREAIKRGRPWREEMIALARQERALAFDAAIEVCNDALAICQYYDVPKDDPMVTRVRTIRNAITRLRDEFTDAT